MDRYNQVPICRTVTIFAAASISLAVKQELVDLWAARGLKLILYDQNYVDAHERSLIPYAFISHDWGDKEKVARPLAEALRSQLGLIWYDEFSLRVGDSLRESIEGGLKKSDSCILLLSKAFFANVRWAKREFETIYIREIIEGRKVMLPVWIDVTPEEVYEYAPILADRIAANWSEGLEVVAQKLSAAIRKPSSGQKP